MAEGLLRTRAAQRSIPVTVSSVGFLYDGEPATPDAVEVMAALDVDISGHRSRIVAAGHVEAADLIVTMERAHARSLCVDVPDAAPRIHTIGVAAQRLGSSPGRSLAEQIDEMGAARSASDLLGGGDDEVKDPFGRPRKQYRQTAARLDRLIADLLDAVSPR